jgi:glucose-1-phosphate cytidylyltransferase
MAKPKVVILAGGLGTRLSEETTVRPKPMVEIGGRPILWHIMKIYAAHGLDEFIVCLGYKGYMIKEYFANYILHNSDVTFDLAAKNVKFHSNSTEPWRVTLVDTGADTMTGGRVKRIGNYLGDGPFCLTYGDGVSNVDITRLLEHHAARGLKATVTAVQPPGRFGALDMAGDNVRAFKEKPDGEAGWINGGFFVLDRSIVGRIADDDTVFEREPLEGLAAEGQLSAFRHPGFWHPMDTLRDRTYLDQLWSDGRAPWKVW